jgi:hypothetical protein
MMKMKQSSSGSTLARHGDFGMTSQIITLSFVVAFCGIFAVLAPAETSAADGLPAAPSDPRLIVPIPILRRHACAADYSVPKKRGVAIMSPIESPDNDCPMVGGKPQCVPYYPDYCTHPHHGRRIAIPDDGSGYCCPGSSPSGAIPAAALPPGVDNSSTYGCYSGGNQNEAMLLHLGGNSSVDPATRPADAPADLIDLIHSGH